MTCEVCGRPVTVDGCRPCDITEEAGQKRRADR
jgi:hypothetical protein